ncbi:MAG: dihydroorotase [Sulfuricurvum sp.]|nr:dihydroorotase [Sulfuricurvum sp.]MDP3023666.1 dihydroorotase [Sulfuricurvum sp.]MDP3119001.1 dihydroorotase [Sulfuricurvum sp.]
MLICNAIICDIHGNRQEDVRIENGVITQIGSNLMDDESIDASGCYLMSGLVDTNVRLKDLQLNGKNLETLSREALSGGVSTVVLSGEMVGRVDNEITLEFVKKHQIHDGGAKIECAISALSEEGNLTNIALLLKKGGKALYTKTISDYNLIMRMAQYLKMSNKPLYYLAQDKSLSESGVMSDGKIATSLGLPGIPSISEVAHIAAMIEIAREYEITIVFKSVIEPRSVELIAQARREGVKVECEVALHHLVHSDAACRGFDTDAKINPPLVSDSKRKKLIEALQRGDIASLTALHQPNSDVYKDITFNDASYGTTSIGEYLPLCYTHLVKPGIIDMPTLSRLTSYVPAVHANIDVPKIEVGQRADMILFNPNESLIVGHHHSLYKNETLSGRVTMAIQGDEITRF